MFPRWLVPLVERDSTPTIDTRLGFAAAFLGIALILSLPAPAMVRSVFKNASHPATPIEIITEKAEAPKPPKRSHPRRSPVRFGEISDVPEMDAWMVETSEDLASGDHLVLLQAQRQLREARRMRAKQDPCLCFIRADP